MKIGIITRHLDLPVGFGTYARNLLAGLARVAPEHQYVVYTPRLPEVTLPPRFTNRASDVPEQRSKLVWWEHWTAPRMAVHDKVDLIHYLHLAGPLPLTRRPVITNVLDAINWAEPGYQLPRHYQGLARRDIRVASHLITISQAARADLNRLLRVPLKKVSVTHLAPAPPETGGRKSAAVTRYLSGKKFFLFIGGTEKRKNLREVMEAYAQSEFTERLAVVGPADQSPIRDSAEDLLEILRPEQRRQVTFLGRVSDADLDRLYRRAVALVFPSRYEGFGLPPLEAMARRTPVITSNVSSLSEIVGEAALTVDPSDAEALAEAMRSLVTDAAVRRKLVKRGTANLKRFSWDNTARETAAIYRQVRS